MARSRQEVRFCTTRDGVRLAYAVSGRGPALVKAANYLGHLERDWDGPVWPHWLRALAHGRRLVRYDDRGCGLSDRDVEDFSMERLVEDLEAVVDAAKLERFALLGISQGASVCVAYAAKHPERVSRLVLLGGYARGRLKREPRPEDELEAETMINAIRVGWGRPNPAFRQLFSTQLMPDATAAQSEWLNELARLSVSPEVAARMERAFYGIDVTEFARQVRAPTLVLHARDDAAVPFDEGRRLAALLPDARFVPLESRNHILTEEEPAWARFVQELDEFLAEEVVRGAALEALTAREREVLELIARGSSNDSIAATLSISPKTVSNHITSLFAKLGVTRRAEAIVVAREAGLGEGRS